MPHLQKRVQFKLCAIRTVQFFLQIQNYIWPSFDPSAQPYTLIPHFLIHKKEHRQFCLFRLRFKNQLEFNKYDLKTICVVVSNRKIVIKRPVIFGTFKHWVKLLEIGLLASETSFKWCWKITKYLRWFQFESGPIGSKKRTGHLCGFSNCQEWNQQFLLPFHQLHQQRSWRHQ